MKKLCFRVKITSVAIVVVTNVTIFGRDVLAAFARFGAAPAVAVR